MLQRVLLAFLLASITGCGGRGERAEETPPPAARTLPTKAEFPKVVIFPPDTSLHLHTEPESLTVFTPGITGRPIEGKPGSWAVDYSWLYLHRLPVHIYTFEEMDSLATAGIINDNTIVGVAVYRVPMEASSPRELSPKALAGKPETYPAGLLAQLERSVKMVTDTTGLFSDTLRTPTTQ